MEPTTPYDSTSGQQAPPPQGYFDTHYAGSSQFGKVQDMNPRTNTYAIVSLVSAFVISPLAVIFGHLSLKQIKSTGEQGRGMAIAGLVLGYLGILVAVAYIVFFVVVLGMAANEMGVPGGGSVTIEELGG